MGSLVVSLDAELSWGVHDLFPLSGERAQRVAVARDAWLGLVDLFDRHRVPATWAVVGHLFTEDGAAYRRRHPLGDEWFARAERGIEERPDRWVGLDLVEALRDSPVDHDIGSHSFSHVVFDEVSAAVAQAECSLAREVAAERGFDTRSFVFPRNAVAHRQALADAGFTCYRGRRPRRLPAVPGLIGGAMFAGAVTGAVAPPVATPRVTDHGLVDVPASMFLGGFRGAPWNRLAAVGEDPAVRLAKAGIDRACRRSGVCHLWLHPNDLTSDAYLDRVDRVLEHAARRRDDGDLRVETMVDVADRTDGVPDE